MTDTERLAEIRERCERANPAGWYGEDVPYLLALVERLTAEVERLQREFQEFKDEAMPYGRLD